MLLISKAVELKINPLLPVCPKCRSNEHVIALLDESKLRVILGCWACSLPWHHEIWPYGPPEFHEDCCLLHTHEGFGFCDCKASDGSDTEWGIGA